MCRNRYAHLATHRKRFVSTLLMVLTACIIPSTSAAQDAATRTTLSGSLTLTEGEGYCIPVTVRPDRPVNLGTGQLTITFSNESKGKDDVVLVSRIIQSQITLPKGSSRLTLCGVVPQLAERQTGKYFASDFAIHFGSGNVTNIGTPDNSLIDTGDLAKQLQALHPTFKR